MVTPDAPSPHSSSSPLSPSSSDLESEGHTEDLIAKPRGEAGRPGRGGYNLEVALAWDKTEYGRLRVCSNIVTSYRC
jgi:hypothetical protein